jgi:hypothetical protein
MWRREILTATRRAMPPVLRPKGTSVRDTRSTCGGRTVLESPDVGDSTCLHRQHLPARGHLVCSVIAGQTRDFEATSRELSPGTQVATRRWVETEQLRISPMVSQFGTRPWSPVVSTVDHRRRRTRPRCALTDRGGRSRRRQQAASPLAASSERPAPLGTHELGLPTFWLNRVTQRPTEDVQTRLVSTLSGASPRGPAGARAGWCRRHLSR